MTTAAALLVAAILAALGAIAGAIAEIPFARRKADAGRSRMPPAARLSAPNHRKW
jgi:hypothetical protein